MITLMDILLSVVLAALGLVFGSFAGAQVWRLRARQLVQDKDAGEVYDKAEYKRLQRVTGKGALHDRSRCLACGKALTARDLMPLFSWLSTKGRCRHCNKPIGTFEPLMELGTMAVFLLSYWFWPLGFAGPYQWGLFGLWLIMAVLLVILTAYDVRWQLLPDTINYTFITFALLFAVLRYAQQPSMAGIVSALGAVGILSGLYAVIYIVSKGQWIGFGDVKLGVGLGLLLGDWRLAFLALFLANLIGCLVVLPGMFAKKLSRSSRIAFGPLLIAGTLIAFWWGTPFVEWLFVKSVLW